MRPAYWIKYKEYLRNLKRLGHQGTSTCFPDIDFSIRATCTTFDSNLIKSKTQSLVQENAKIRAFYN
ncbi:hypothetical protein FRX31_024010 [Thalictrum thalictroides]|uniref:Uncharacterized protein n=1 Tax=Thalictrum thalictroides TaxID=46969 RepID=A0A7J6VND8_THATH|nr:hypothetical protein FRX31_024010 [Thalictrum thalictroides]